MSAPKPWRKADIAQPISGRAIKEPETVIRELNKAKRPLVIVGHRVAYPDNEDTPYLDYVIRFAKTRKIPIAATGHTVKAFLEVKHPVVSWLSAMDVVNRVIDPEWQGFDGKGPYDLVFMTGLPQEMTSLLLNAIKHYTRIKSILLDRFFVPNASLSYPNLREKKWLKELDALIEGLSKSSSRSKAKEPAKPVVKASQKPASSDKSKKGIKKPKQA